VFVVLVVVLFVGQVAVQVAVQVVGLVVVLLLWFSKVMVIQIMQMPFPRSDPPVP